MAVEILVFGDLLRIEQGHRFAEKGDHQDHKVLAGEQSEDVSQDHPPGDAVLMVEGEEKEGGQGRDDPALHVPADEARDGEAGAVFVFAREEGNQQVKPVVGGGGNEIKPDFLKGMAFMEP